MLLALDPLQPDQTFRTLKRIYRRISCSKKMRNDGFSGSKFEKCLVGVVVSYAENVFSDRGDTDPRFKRYM